MSHVDLEPTLGHEQAGKRYVIVVSPDAFNRISSPLCCPISMGGNYSLPPMREGMHGASKSFEYRREYFINCAWLAD